MPETVRIDRSSALSELHKDSAVKRSHAASESTAPSSDCSANHDPRTYGSYTY